MATPATLAMAALFAAEEDPTRTHHWLWPEGAEVLWGTLSFLVVAFLLWKFGWPQAKKMMHARTARIQAELEEAARALADAKEAAASIRAAKGDIASERQRILGDADEQAARLIADGRARLEQEVADLRAKAESELEAVRSRLQSEVQGEVAEVAARATEIVVVESLEAELQQELVEDFIARVGAAS